MEAIDRFMITPLSDQAVLDVVNTLRMEGSIVLLDNYCYLKIDDRFIHFVQPLLTVHGIINKPDYFNPPDHVGAHISIIYPEECIQPLAIYKGQKHQFSVCSLCKIRYRGMDYFVLVVESPSLMEFRKKHHLAPLPTFKKQEVVFHITVGIKTK